MQRHGRLQFQYHGYQFFPENQFKKKIVDGYFALASDEQGSLGRQERPTAAVRLCTTRALGSQ